MARKVFGPVVTKFKSMSAVNTDASILLCYFFVPFLNLNTVFLRQSKRLISFRFCEAIGGAGDGNRTHVFSLGS